MTIIDSRLLYKFENDKKNLVVLGVVDMRQLLLNLDNLDKIEAYISKIKIE